MKIAVIGAGIFGLSAAIKLSEVKKIKVFVFDKNNEILSGSTYANHNRHHYGFHYPRSQLTLNEINSAKDEFEFYYKKACNFDFNNFYAISKFSKVSASKYIEFLEKNRLQYKKVRLNKKIFNKKNIDLVLKVNEGVYDFKEFNQTIKKRIKKFLKIKLDHKFISGIKKKNFFELKFLNKKKIINYEFDFVINATYSNINSVIESFGFPKKKYEFNLQQLAIISFPNKKKIGATVMDGSFPSILPIGNSCRHLFAHVQHSQLIKKITNNNLFFETNFIQDQFEKIKYESEKFLPILKHVNYHGSIYVNRVVNNNVNDDRLSDLIKHDENFFSILGGKIITCEKTANQLVAYIKSKI